MPTLLPIIKIVALIGWGAIELTKEIIKNRNLKIEAKSKISTTDKEKSDV